MSQHAFEADVDVEDPVTVWFGQAPTAAERGLRHDAGVSSTVMRTGAVFSTSRLLPATMMYFAGSSAPGRT